MLSKTSRALLRRARRNLNPPSTAAMYTYRAMTAERRWNGTQFLERTVFWPGWGKEVMATIRMMDLEESHA